jgi:hypothetical protein
MTNGNCEIKLYKKQESCQSECPVHNTPPRRGRQKNRILKKTYIWQITEHTMLTLEERLKGQVPFIAVEHNDHTENRHVHVLACVKGKRQSASR